MGFFDTLLNGLPDVPETYGLAQEVKDMQEQLDFLQYENAELQESLLEIADNFDRIGFGDLSQEETTEMPLRTVKKMASVARSLVTMNPFVKRGVKARVSYVWGKGVQFDKTERVQSYIDQNRKKLFTSQAFEELEMTAAADGNVFRAIPLDTERNDDEDATALRIPLDQITDAVSNPDDLEEIWYYKRTYKVRKTDSKTGNVSERDETRYYMSMEYYKKRQKQGRGIPRRWKDAGVDQNYVMLHIAVNRQVGWRWGVPDVAAVIMWAAAYKDYLEDNTKLVKAYARIAWQVKASTQSGAQAAAAQVMAPPTRDAMTGELRSVGGSAVTGTGIEMNPVGNNASQVDFSKGLPLASAIASGLEVSLVVITSDAGTANRSAAETLDLPTLKAMESRQLLWTEMFKELFEFWNGADVLITWPQIYNDTTKDRVAALGMTKELGLVYPEEARKEALDVLGIAPFKPWDELPDPADDPLNKYKEEQAEKAFEKQQKAAETQAASVIPGQGKSGGVAAKGGAMTNNNEARDNRSKDKNKS